MKLLFCKYSIGFLHCDPDSQEKLRQKSVFHSFSFVGFEHRFLTARLGVFYSNHLQRNVVSKSELHFI